MSADAFEGAKVLKPNRVTWGKVGNYIIGYYYGSKVVDTNNGKATIYELKGLMGEYNELETTDDGNGNKLTKVLEPAIAVEAGDFYNLFGGKDTIDSLFKKSKLGQKVGLRFTKATPSKTKGNSPFKTIETAMWDEVDPEFMGQGFEDVTGQE